MQNIIEHLEKATRPDRALDWEIHLRNGLDGVGSYGQHPSYTASVDDALTLMPRGIVVRLTLCSDGDFQITECWFHRDADDDLDGVEPLDKKVTGKPAIALCITAIKAEQATKSVTPA